MGRVRNARVGAEPARGRQRPRRRRARLRHRLLLLVAGAPRRPGRRRRSHPGAARNRAEAPGRDRDRVSVDRGDRRGRAAAGFVVRPRSLRVRRIALGRPLPLGSGGGALASTRRAACLSDQLDRLRALHDHGRCRRAARTTAVRVGQVRVAGHDTRSSSTSLTATGSPFCTRTGSRSSASSSCSRTPSRKHIRTTSTSRPSGRESGLTKKRGPRVNVADAPPSPPLLLASTSPQRKAILQQLHIPFDVIAPTYEEQTPPDGDPVQVVREHARGKARSVADVAEDRPVARRRHRRRARRPDLRQAHERVRRRADARRAERQDACRRLRALPPHTRLGGRRARSDPGCLPGAGTRASSARTLQPANGRAGRAPTRSRVVARRSSARSKATT